MKDVEEIAEQRSLSLHGSERRARDCSDFTVKGGGGLDGAPRISKVFAA